MDIKIDLQNSDSLLPQKIHDAAAETGQAKSSPASPPVQVSLSASALEGSRLEFEASERSSDGDEIQSQAQASQVLSVLRGQMTADPAKFLASYSDGSAQAVMQLLA